MAVSDPSAARSPRDATFDILKGLSILEVMTHHLLGASMRKFAEEYSATWWVMATLSRILHFAVPTFLLVSAILLARSVVSKPVADWKRFYARRVQRTLIPYLVWSVIYVLFRCFVMRAEGDLQPIELSRPLFGLQTLPRLLVPEGLLSMLIWGKSYYHIYFMVVLLQFSLVFPGLLLFVQCVRLSFVGIVTVGLAIQYVCFRVQNWFLHMPFPGSTILWYMAPVIVGIWIGVRWREWGEVWARRRIAIGLLAAGGLSVYLPLALMHFRHQPIPSLPYNLGIATYCLGVALLLLALSQRIARMPRLARLIQPIGDRSIVFFLIHPMVLYLLSGPSITSVFSALPAPPIWLGLAMFGVTWVASQATHKLRLDGILFAR